MNDERDLGRLEGKMDGINAGLNQLAAAMAKMETKFSDSIEKLSGAFMEMEKGRLTTLERDFGRFQVEYETKAKMGAMLWGTVGTVIGSVLTAVVAGVILFLITGR